MSSVKTDISRATARGAAANYNWIAGVVVHKESKKMKKIWCKILELLGLDSICTPSKKLSPIKVGDTQVWYGRVNWWWKSRSLWQKEMDCLVKNGGSGYMIELAGWRSAVGQESKWWTDAWVKNQLELYKQIHKDAKDRGLWLFVSIVNDNMGSGKYGDKKQFNVGNCYDKCVKLLEGIIKDGKDNVIIQPVAETQTNGGHKFEDYAKYQLAKAGFLTCNNGSGGHPSSANGMNFYAVHPSKVAAANPSNSFVISDHGLIIREMNQGGALVAHGNPAKVAQFVQNNKKRGVPVVGYYAFLVQDYDGDTIKALGNSVKSSAFEKVGEEITSVLFEEDPNCYEVPNA